MAGRLVTRPTAAMTRLIREPEGVAEHRLAQEFAVAPRGARSMAEVVTRRPVRDPR
jgi:hypothetical protein